ncbi:glycosyltransferase family 2 protein [Leptolyngbya sp. AN02str]|uniref:glycosyltransferase family 2 protein n=1 Tax=Leptolyngbya sp. AN02str TaxID=3423363 RepID=UPI003D31D0DD
MRVAVCALTYKRPDGLKRLLDGLNQLTFEQYPQPEIEVIIVDNDSPSEAETICADLRPTFRWSLKYVVETQRGISFARNRAIASAASDTDFVAFIDDDEVPEPNWLEQLLIVQQQYDADIVGGPALPYFANETVPDWIAKGKFFDTPRYETGHLLEVAYTNNVLIRNRIFQTMPQPFDARFAVTGGEDSHLFMRLYRAGYKLVWADTAIVHEWIPASRMTLKWLMQRGYRSYSTHGLCELELDPAIRVVPRRVTTGCGRIVLGLLMLPISVVQPHLFAKSLLQISRGAGMLSGLAGRRYEEYRTVHSV